MDRGLVSVITPVFNAELYLAECIESVLGQTHGNLEYIIADNCSTDRSLEVARSFESKDKRIRVVAADEHVGPIQNWNRSLNEVDPKAVFVKFVHADDWIYPDCIEKMVDAATDDERVGIVSAYRLEEDEVSLDRLPNLYSGTPGQRKLTMDGREVVRATFMEYASVLGSPTSLLFRHEVIRRQTPFFDESYLHADKEACIRALETWNLGFVREVLTFTRRHNDSVTSMTDVLDTRRQDDLLMLRKHGARFLSDDELQIAQKQMLRFYYAFLARSVGCGKGKVFWSSQRNAFRRAGLPYARMKLLLALIRHWFDFRSALKNLIRSNEQNEDKRSVSAAKKFTDAIRQDRT